MRYAVEVGCAAPCQPREQGCSRPASPRRQAPAHDRHTLLLTYKAIAQTLLPATVPMSNAALQRLPCISWIKGYGLGPELIMQKQARIPT